MDTKHSNGVTIKPKLQNDTIDKDLIFKIIKIFVLIIIIFKVGYEISFTSDPNDSWEKTLQKKILAFVIMGTLFWVLASYTKGQFQDKIVTLVILIVLYGIIRYSFWMLTDFFDLSTSNPIVVGYFIMIGIISLMILVSRYTQLNLIKSMGWIIGLMTVGFFLITLSILGTLEICEGEQDEGGIEDPMQTVLSIFSAWALLFGLLLWTEGQDWTGIRNDPSKCTLRYTLFAIILIAGCILTYTWTRCAGADKSTEESAIAEEPSWVNMSAHLSTVLAWLSVFIGHNFSAAFLGFMTFGILDQCAPKDDPRKTAITSLLIIVLPIIYLIKWFSRITKK